jgi:hypothetical protein
MDFLNNLKYIFSLSLIKREPLIMHIQTIQDRDTNNVHSALFKENIIYVNLA